MRNKSFTPLFLSIALLILAGCADSTPADPAPIAAATQVPTETVAPPTLTPLATPAPPTATAAPTGTPTPLSVATAPATFTPTPSKTRLTLTDTPTPLTYGAKAGAYLEWILPEPAPKNLISISGGLIGDFGVDGDYAFIFMGQTMAIVDMSVEPIGEEVSRFLFSDRPSSAVRSGRFLFVFVVGEGVKVFDVTDPANASPVAWIKGVGSGRLHLGENSEVLFERSEGTWLELDVDQVEPAFWLPESPEIHSSRDKDWEFHSEIFDPHWESVSAQIDEIMPGGTHWFPENIQIQGDDVFYQTATRGEAGGGQVVRLDISDPDNLKVKSIFRSFETANIDYENGSVYTAFLYEIAGGGSQIDVRNPAKPSLIKTLEFWANAHVVVDSTLLAGDQPGLATFDLTGGLTKLGEFLMSKEKPRYPFLDQLVTNTERTVLFGLTGIYGETGGIAVYSIEIPTQPVPLSFIDADSPIEIKYAADRLYAYRTNQPGESVITVFNVTDPGNPEEMMSWVTEEQVIGLEAWQDGAGRHFLAALTPDEISIWDVTDPTGAYQQLGRLFAPPQCVVEPSNNRYHRPTTLAGDWLFAPLGKCPTSRIDISDPANPIILETLDSNGPMIYEDGLLFMGDRNLRIYKFE